MENCISGSTVTFGCPALAWISSKRVVAFNLREWKCPAPISVGYFAIRLPMVSNSVVTNIFGAAIPRVSGNGVGQGSPEGPNVLLASIDYAVTACCSSVLYLKIGQFGIADWDGNFPQLRFGSETAPILKGDQIGASGHVGTLFHTEAPLIPVDVDLGNQPRGSLIDHTFTVSASAGDVTWSDLVVKGPGTPAIAPSISADGRFTWDSTNSPLGTWTFDATVRDQFGPAVGHLSINLVVPEPTSSVLAFLAIAVCGIPVRRCKLYS